jgi:hypothetical protein
MAEILILGNLGFLHHAQPILEHYGERAAVISDYSPQKLADLQPKLLITFEASNVQRGLCTAEMMRRGIATLLVMDGIQEWRNTWSRLELVDKRPLNQPALVHKIACLGRIDAHLYESWGNIGKCEVVGAPRLDDLVIEHQRPKDSRENHTPYRLLVMTARNPGFTPEERETTLRSLADLKAVLDRRNDIQVVWRISKGLHLKLGVENTFTSATGTELHELLPQMDGVITTPSTAQLEGMLAGLPVALLNYHLVPVYTPAAWEIKCSAHIDPVLADLIKPPLERLIYQDYCLHESLNCTSPAAPRLFTLIDQILAVKTKADELNTPLIFPDRILDAPEPFVAWPSQHFDLKTLYPDHQVFAQWDTVTLQSELDAALLAVEQLKKDVQLLTDRLNRVPGYAWLRNLVRSIQRRFYLGGHYRV